MKVKRQEALSLKGKVPRLSFLLAAIEILYLMNRVYNFLILPVLRVSK